MKAKKLPGPLGVFVVTALTLLVANLRWSVADSVEMTNGDRYVGRVLSVDGSTVRLQNPNLGTVTLPRTNVQQIVFGNSTNAVTGSVRAATPTNNTANLSQQIQTSGIDPKLKDQIQQQFLSAAGPEANEKFNALVQGLLSGTTSIEDIRAQARSTVTQVRSLQKELGPESGEALEGYLQILENFLRETQPPSTNASASPPARK